MSYVPIVPQPPTPSPRTRDLADRLMRVVVDFEEAHPAVTKGEIRQAAQLALRGTRSTNDGVAVAILGLVVVLVFVLFYFFQRG